eukprot:5779894-Pleurochrysis_carterae.AAC.1
MPPPPFAHVLVRLGTRMRARVHAWINEAADAHARAFARAFFVRACMLAISVRTKLSLLRACVC